MARLDPHSFADDEQPRVEHFDWQASVDFDHRRLQADIVLRLASTGQCIDLDTRELEIRELTDQNGADLRYSLFDPDPIIGSKLRIILNATTEAVRIHYLTSPRASALQWLEPEQTFGGKLPFLFSQCQAIHARSVIPIQDTPRIRVTFRAELTVPKSLRALIAAALVKREERDSSAIETFEMPYKIPPYLFALAVGQLEGRNVGPRSRIWAEPAVVEKAAWEFGQVDHMLQVAERLFGPYEWGRFDVLTMPQSFPYGGMENPCLTFLTPTVIAGDRSLVNVLAHELAHSWTGNLVSNASAEHFWLNEGFTVYAERRILEALEGPEMASLHEAIGYRSLEEALARFSQRPELTHLRTRLAGIDPDEAYSQVPYEKGYLFLHALEKSAGRDAFDRFLRSYVQRFKFRSITTDDFEDLANEELPGALDRIGAAGWIDEPNLPPGASKPHSKRLTAIREIGNRPPQDEMARSWSAMEWQVYLESLSHPAPLDLCQTLDQRFNLSESSNYEVLTTWLTLAVASGFEPAIRKTAEVVANVGRMKYVRPLYLALARLPRTQLLATDLFQKFKGRYHPIARGVIQKLLLEIPSHAIP